VDDTTREKTNQEVAMISNAPRYATLIPMAQMDPNQKAKAEVGFDTYLRHVIKILATIEEASDTKNVRGFTVVKNYREEVPRFGLCPTCEALDPRDLIVPTDTKHIQKARFLTEIIRWSEGEFKSNAKRHPKWKNVDVIITRALRSKRDDGGGHGVTDAFEETKHLVGVTTANTKKKRLVLWAHWHYATQWDVEQDGSGRVKKGRKCCTIFSPDSPDDVLAVFPWRERDVVQELGPDADPEDEPEVVLGADKPWPYSQPRFENRSKQYYDTRGIGRLCMDDQLAASALQNMKLTLYDYYQQPMLTGDERPSGNISHEPGSFLPGNVQYVTPPAFPANFDFDINNHKRVAARRVGAMSQYEFSSDMSSKKGIQKTATEVAEESARGATVSSVDVDRFNQPWADVFQMIWDDLAQMRKPLPMIDGDEYQGEAPEDIYDVPMLVVPAGNAKTMNPDMQFNRAMAAWDFVRAQLDLGVVVDVDGAIMDILSHWDPMAAMRWLRTAGEEGPQGQLPVYQVLQQVEQKLQQNTEQDAGVMDTLKALAALAEENAQRLDQVLGAQA